MGQCLMIPPDIEDGKTPSDKSMKNSMTSVIGVLACHRMMDSMEFKQAEKTITKLINMGTGMLTLNHNLMNMDLIYCYLVNNNGLEFIPEIMDTELEKFIKKMKDIHILLALKVKEKKYYMQRKALGILKINLTRRMYYF